MTSATPLLLLDTASLYFRAFFGVPDRRERPGDPPTNAVRGLLDMIATLVTAHAPGAVVACWDDDWRPAFRVAAIPTYKAHRVADATAATAADDPAAAAGASETAPEEVPDDLAPQVPVIAAVLAAVGLARVGSPGFEADDVIGTLTTRAAGRRPVRIVTGDRDLFQLVDDAADVAVLYTARGGVRDPDLVTQTYLRDEHGVPTGDAYADLAVLRGDPSDGLPGVRGVGGKTGAKLLADYGSLAGLREAVAAGRGPKGAIGSRLAEADAYLDAAIPVVRVARDCPLPEVSGAVPDRVADPAALAALVDTYGIGGPLTRLLTALGTRP